MASLEIALLQANAHWQDLSVRHLGPLSPLLRPVGQMTLVEAVGGRNFTLCPRSSILVRERTGHGLEDEAASQCCHKGLEQHDVSFSDDEFEEKCEAILV